MANNTIEAILRISAKMGDMRALRTLQGELRKVDGQAKAFNRTNGAVANNVRAAWAATARFIGPAAVAYGTKRAVTEFASVERRLNRIAINAGEGKSAVSDMMNTINTTSREYATSQDDVAAGLETLVAAGRDAKDAMSFLPAVTATAQAAGAEITDIASTADAVAGSFGFAGENMQKAFDILVTSGKQGKFELRDMAQYLPTLAPAFAALGYKGEEGLGKLASMLQTVRLRTGDASEAANAVQNVLQKMETDATAKKFKEFGINLRKEMAKARKEGRDLVDVFLELTEKATKGNLSLLPQLFPDMQVQVGMRALRQGRDALDEFQNGLKNVDGSTLKDLNQVLSDTQSKVDKMSSSFKQAFLSLGGVTADVLNPTLDRVNSHLDFSAAMEAGMEKRGLSNAQKWQMRMLGSAQDRGLIAYEAGWRSEAGKKAVRERMASPDAGMSWRKVEPDQAPVSNVPMPRPENTGFAGLPEPRYNRFAPFSAQTLQENERVAYLRDNPMAKKIPGGEMFTGGFASADELKAAIGGGGEDAGRSIEEAARTINEQAKQGGSVFRSMLDGMGEQIGRDAAAAFKANIGTITVNTRMNRVNADVGRSGADVDAGGQN